MSKSTKLCEGPLKPHAAKLLAKARKDNAKRDANERSLGLACPGRCDLPTHLRTVIAALSAGLSLQSWEDVAEGLAMLQDAELRARNGDYNAAPGVSQHRSL